MVFPKKSRWNLSRIIGKDHVSLSWKYDLNPRRKMKDDLFQKNTRKYDIFFRSSEKKVFLKGPRWDMIFLVLSGKMVFFSRKHDLFSLGRKWKTAFLGKYMETWCIAQRRKTGNLIYRIEVWLLLKFIRLEIFYNE